MKILVILVKESEHFRVTESIDTCIFKMNPHVRESASHPQRGYNKQSADMALYQHDSVYIACGI